MSRRAVLRALPGGACLFASAPAGAARPPDPHDLADLDRQISSLLRHHGYAEAGWELRLTDRLGIWTLLDSEGRSILR